MRGLTPSVAPGISVARQAAMVPAMCADRSNSAVSWAARISAVIVICAIAGSPPAFHLWIRALPLHQPRLR